MFRPQTWLNRGFGLHPARVASRSSTHVSVRPELAFQVRRGNATLQLAVPAPSVPGHGVASLSSTRVREAWFAPGAVHCPATPVVSMQVPDPVAHDPIRRIDGLPSVV